MEEYRKQREKEFIGRLDAHAINQVLENIGIAPQWGEITEKVDFHCRVDNITPGGIAAAIANGILMCTQHSNNKHVGGIIVQLQPMCVLATESICTCASSCHHQRHLTQHFFICARIQ
jgi:hypothetical protein